VEQIARVLDHFVKELFPDGAVLRAELLRDGDDPGQLTVRVFIPATEDLAAWATVHRERMDELRRELSLRLPSARLLEFTSDGPAAAVISMPDDGSLAAEQLPSRDIAARALALLRENYVFPELAEQVAAAVETRLAAGEYDNLDEITLTELLTSHLQEASGDKHLRVRLGGAPGPGRRDRGRRPGSPDGGDRAEPERGEPADREARRRKMRQVGRLDNFGIHRVERLDGNIGYLDLRRVPMPENAGPAIAAAMELVSGTYALIIDLRQNGGGQPAMVTLIASYLFDHSTHLIDIYNRKENSTTQNWTLSYLPGPRLAKQPVFVLTSKRTFSGAEEFAFDLKNQKRATIVGETTGGGAHPVSGHVVGDYFTVGVPFAKSLDPVTKTNWEGTGVEPDVKVPAADALATAEKLAMEKIQAKKASN